MLYPKSRSYDPVFFVVLSPSGSPIRSGTVHPDFIDLQASAPGESVVTDGAMAIWEAHLEALANPVLSLDQRRADLLSKLASRRWEVECGGTSLGGNPVATDDRAKLLITGAYSRAQQNPEYTTRWKTADGEWTTIDSPTIEAVYGVVFEWVDRCFHREGELSDEISRASSNSDLDALESKIKAFWP